MHSLQVLYIHSVTETEWSELIPFYSELELLRVTFQFDLQGSRAGNLLPQQSLW